MKPAPVTDFLLHDLVMSAAAEGAVRTAVAAAVTLDERILLCGQDTGDFQREWGLPGGMPLPGETLTDALSRVLACGYGLDVTESGTYLGSHDSIHGGEVIRTFVFTATCADPARSASTPASPTAGLTRQTSPSRPARISPAWPTSPCSQPQPPPPARPAHARSPPRSAPGPKGSTATKPPPNCSSGTGPGFAGATSPRGSSSPRPARPGTSPQPSAGKRRSPPCRQEPFPAQAARPPYSTWPPASPGNTR